MKKFNPFLESIKYLISSIKISRVLKKMTRAYNKSLDQMYGDHLPKYFLKARQEMLLVLLSHFDYLGQNGKKALLNYYCDNLKDMDFFDQEMTIKFIPYLLGSLPESERSSKLLVVIHNADKINRKDISKIMEIPEAISLSA